MPHVAVDTLLLLMNVSVFGFCVLVEDRSWMRMRMRMSLVLAGIFIERICRRNACTSHADSCRIVVW